MQTSINVNAPLPFPTPDERVRLMGAYDSSETRGYLSAHQLTKLAKKMGVTPTSVRRWFSDERMSRGHHTEYTKYPIDTAKGKKKPPAVEVRTQLPLHRGRHTQGSQSGGPPETRWTPKGEGEYEEEDNQDEKISVTWTEGLEQMTMYPFDQEAHEVPVNPHGVGVPEGCLVLGSAGADSQENGGGKSETGHRESCPQVPAQKDEPGKYTSSRDPRRRAVMLASPLTLFGEVAGSGSDTTNISQPTPSASLMEEADALMEEAGWEPRLIIDIESE